MAATHPDGYLALLSDGECLTGADHLHAVPLGRWFPKRTYGLVLRKGRPLSPAADRFVEMIRSELSSVHFCIRRRIRPRQPHTPAGLRPHRPDMDLEAVPVYMDNLNRVLPRGEVLPVPLPNAALDIDTRDDLQRVEVDPAGNFRPHQHDE